VKLPKSYELKRQVQLQTRSVTRDTATGAEVESWVSATVWAKVVESSTAVISGVGAVDNYARPHKVWIRWRALDKSQTRISYNGRLLRITGSAEIADRQWLELACEEWVHE
jgi:SPP1 family predicted phage head-tail adaptor